MKMRLLILIFTLGFFSLGYAANETITITTYYPSPYGAFNNLYVANKTGVGTTNPGAARLTVENGTISHDDSNVFHGNNTSIATHLNLGIASVTGTSGQNYTYCTISGGNNNNATRNFAVVAGGTLNTAGNEYTVARGGNNNNASGSHSIVSGGRYNNATNTYATIGGGYANAASQPYTVIGGGNSNKAAGNYSIVVGGSLNNASGENITIGGGAFNNATGFSAVIFGGNSNKAQGDYSTVGGTVNNASGAYSTVSGGGDNQASSWGSLVVGGGDNIASGMASTLGGGVSNDASGTNSTIGGGYNNTAASYTSVYGNGSTVVFGGMNNFVDDWATTIIGGEANQAPSHSSSVGGGHNNTATTTTHNRVIGGGYNNSVTGNHSAIGAGRFNQVTGSWAMVEGGIYNNATGDYSWAGGCNANADATNSFVWGGDDAGVARYANGANTFNIYAAGIYFNGGSIHDVAEFMDAAEQDAPQEAEIVSLAGADLLGKAKTSYDPNILGVISSKKTATLHLGTAQDPKPGTVRLPIALSGRCYVKACAESGTIELGDAITSSSIPGIGMKAARSGKIIGYAMEKAEFKDPKEIKEILVFVKLDDYISSADLIKLSKI